MAIAMNRGFRWGGLILGVVVAGAAVVAGLRFSEVTQLRSRLPVEPDFSAQSESFRSAFRNQSNEIGFFGDLDSGLRSLGMLYHANRYFSEALLVYDVLIEKDPDNPYWVYLAADVYQSLSDFKSMETSLARVVEMGDEYSPSLFKLGRLEMQRRNYEAAEKLLLRALKVNDRSIAIHDKLIQLYGRMRDLDKKAVVSQARVRLGDSTLVEADPWLDDIYDYCYDAEQLLVRADILIETGSVERAIRYLDRSSEIDRSNWKPHAMRMYLEEREGNLDAAIAAGKDAIEKGADIGIALSQITTLLIEKGDASGAENLIKSELLSNAGNVVLYQALAQAQEAGAKTTLALRSLRQAEELNASDAGIQQKLGALLWKTGRKASAVVHFERAVSLSPLDSKSTLYLAQYYIEREDFEKGESYVLKALALEPKNTELRALSSSFFERYGLRQLGLGNTEDAIRIFQLLADWSVEPIRAKQQLANALFKADRSDEGMALLLDLVSDGVANPEVFMTLGELAYADADNESALSYFREVVLRGGSNTDYARLVAAASQRIRDIETL